MWQRGINSINAFDAAVRQWRTRLRAHVKAERSKSDSGNYKPRLYRISLLESNYTVR